MNKYLSKITIVGLVGLCTSSAGAGLIGNISYEWQPIAFNVSADGVNAHLSSDFVNTTTLLKVGKSLTLSGLSVMLLGNPER